jgi:hypothetical protein
MLYMMDAVQVSADEKILEHTACNECTLGMIWGCLGGALGDLLHATRVAAMHLRNGAVWWNIEVAHAAAGGLPLQLRTIQQGSYCAVFGVKCRGVTHTTCRLAGCEMAWL